jgi:hypothetical protein
VISRLIAQLDFRAIERTTLPLAETEDGGNVPERAIRLASMVFRLLKISMNGLPKTVTSPVKGGRVGIFVDEFFLTRGYMLSDSDTTKNNNLASALVICGEHCKSRIGRIEIVRNAKLERVYFAIPPSCRYVSPHVKAYTQQSCKEEISQ